VTLLSEDDLNLAELSDEELALAWDLWFDLAQATNDDDPPYTHGVLTTLQTVEHRTHAREPIAVVPTE
jgi:hypothetical protein